MEKTPGELYPPELRTKINLFLQSKLLLDWKTYAAHYYHNGAFWCRCSAQVFNEVGHPVASVPRVCRLLIEFRYPTSSTLGRRSMLSARKSRSLCYADDVRTDKILL